jgi:hypothetical protein
MYLTFLQKPTVASGSIVTTAARSFVQLVDLSSMSGDTFEVSHMLGSTSVIVNMYSPEGEWFVPSSITALDSQTVLIDLSYFENKQGTWTVVVGAKTKSFGLGMTGFSTGFTQAALSNQEIIITHALGSSSVLVGVYDSSNYLYDPKSIVVVDENSIKLSFSYGDTLLGTWKVVVIASTQAKGNVKGFSTPFTKDMLVLEKLLVTHGLGSSSVIAQVYDGEAEQFIPSSVRTLDGLTLELGLQDIPDSFDNMTVSILAVV